jgi:hypothetical protein
VCADYSVSSAQEAFLVEVRRARKAALQTYLEKIEQLQAMHDETVHVSEEEIV